MSVPNRLREARDAAGLSQAQVAKKLQMHRPTITEIEAGRRRVTAEEIERFAKLYGVPIEWIVSGPSDKSPDPRIMIAARELSKMSQTDLERLMKMLRMLRKS